MASLDDLHHDTSKVGEDLSTSVVLPGSYAEARSLEDIHPSPPPPPPPPPPYPPPPPPSKRGDYLKLSSDDDSTDSGLEWALDLINTGQCKAECCGMEAHTLDQNPILHGEIFHASVGRIQKFLLIPYDLRLESERILGAMCDPGGWDLNIPQMTIQVQGPEGRWIDSVETSLSRELWGKDPETRSIQFQDSINKLCESVIEASVESKAWMWSTSCSYYSTDHAGVVTSDAVDHYCNEHPIDSAKLVYVACKSGNVRSHDGYPQLSFPESINLADYAVPLGQPVKKRLRYPDLRGAVWPDEVNRGAAFDLVPEWPTHMVFLDDENRGDMLLEALLTRTVPHASVVVGGIAWDMKFPRVINFCVELVNRGSLCVLMDHSGIWVEILAQAVKLRRQAMEAERASAFQKNQDPERKWITLDDIANQDTHVEVRCGFRKEIVTSDIIKHNMDRTSKMLQSCKGLRKFIVFDSIEDKPEKVVDTLTTALSIASGEDTNELGSEETEHERLSYAWELHLLFEHNAIKQWYRAVANHWLIVCASFVTTACAVFLSASEIPDDGDDPRPGTILWLPNSPTLSEDAQMGFAFMCSSLPLLSTFLLSLSSKFNPLRRFGALIVGSRRVRTEIYRYRARISEYSRASNSEVIQNIVARRYSAPQHNHVTPNVPRRMSNASTSLGNEKKSDARNDKKSSATGPKSAKNVPALFAETLLTLHNELMTGQSTLGSLRKPPPGAFEELTKSLFTGDKKEPREKKIPHVVQRSLAMHYHSDYTLMSAQYSNSLFDDGISFISSDNYILFRMGPRIKELNEAAPALELCYFLHQTIIFTGTVLSGIFSLIGLRVWIPLVIAFVAAADGVAEFHRVAARLASTNAALTQLKNLKIWWQSLSRVQKRDPGHKTYLVEATEDAIMASYEIWGQGMIRHRKHMSEADEDD